MQRRNMIVGWLVLGAVVLVLVSVALQVEDWRRDLTQNYAQTDEYAPDELLQPLRVGRSPAETAALIRKAASGLKGWEEVRNDEEQAAVTLRFVRVTPLLRFRDDITVRLQARGAETLVHAESQSRVGRGDLGQNPRNLKELLRAVCKLI